MVGKTVRGKRELITRVGLKKVPRKKETSARKSLMQAVSAVWGDQLRNTYGAEVPENYVCFDCETLRVDLYEDNVPTEIGHCIVRNREAVQKGSQVINWAKLWTGRKREWFWEEVDKICEIMRKKGEWRLDCDYIRKHGRHPRRVLEEYAQIFHKARGLGYFFVGHNAWRYDVPLLERVFQEVALKEPFFFGPMEVLDTGVMEKAVQINRPPFPGETMEEYCIKVANQPYKGVFWAMSPHCIKKYRLAERYGINPDDAHQAAADAYCCHLIFEEHRFNGNNKDQGG